MTTFRRNALQLESVPWGAQFGQYVMEHAAAFTPRDWVVSAIQDWLSDHSGARFLLLTGEPGSGKTALMAQLALLSADTAAETALSPSPSAFHFCSVHDIRWTDPLIFARWLALQLAVSVPGFADALIGQSCGRDIRIDVVQRVGEADQVVGVSIANLELGGLQPEAAFAEAVLEPLRQAADSLGGRQVWIGVDGLDESLTRSGRMTIASLLAGVGSLSPSVRFLVTSRPDSKVTRGLERAGARLVELTSGAGLAHSREDVKRHVERELAAGRAGAGRLGRMSVEDYSTAIADRSDGNFLYAKYALAMQASEPGELTLEALDRLPPGLDGIYLEFLERLAGEDWATELAPICGLLAVAGEPLTEMVIAELTATAADVTRRRLVRMRQLLDADEEVPWADRGNALYHRSLAEFLVDPHRAEEYWCDAKAGRGRVADYYLTCFGGLAAGLPALEQPGTLELHSGYPFRQLAMHLRDTDRAQDLFDLLNTESWYQAQAAIDPTGTAFLADVDCGLSAAEKAGTKSTRTGTSGALVAREIELAVMAASIYGFSKAVPAPLIPALIEYVGWSPGQALIAARQQPEEYARAEAFAAIATTLSGDSARAAVTAAEAINQPWVKIGALRSLIPRLAGGERDSAISRMLEWARSLDARDHRAALIAAAATAPAGRRQEIITDARKEVSKMPKPRNWERWEALRDLATIAEGDDRLQLAEETLAAAAAVEEPKLRLEARIRSMPLVADEEREAILMKAQQDMRQIDGRYERSLSAVKVAAASAGAFRERMLDEALSVLADVTDSPARKEIITAAAPLVSGSRFNQAWDLADRIGDPHSRVCALACLVSRSSEGGLQDEVDYVVHAARKTGPQTRADVLIELLPVLRPEDQGPAAEAAWAATRFILDVTQGGKLLTALAAAAPSGDRGRILRWVLDEPRISVDVRAEAFALLSPLLSEEDKRSLIGELSKQIISLVQDGPDNEEAETVKSIVEQRFGKLLRSEMCVRAIGAVFDPPHDYIGAVLVDIIRTITVPGNRASAIEAAAPLIPGERLEQVLDMVAAMEADPFRVQALTSLAPRLSSKLATKAWAIATATTDPWERLRGQIALLGSVEPSEREPVAGRLLDDARRLTDKPRPRTPSSREEDRDPKKAFQDMTFSRISYSSHGTRDIEPVRPSGATARRVIAEVAINRALGHSADADILLDAARSIADAKDRLLALTEVAQLQAGFQAVALREAADSLALIEGDDNRLAALTPELADAPPGALYPVWHQLLCSISARPRPVAMERLTLLAPFVPVLGGSSAAAEAAAAVKRVTARWP